MSCKPFRNLFHCTISIPTFSTMSLPLEADVVIVGAGPTGLLTACFLRKAGVEAIVLDSAASPATTSRASLVHLRTLEIFEKLDLAESIIKQSLPIDGIHLRERDDLLSKLDFTNLHNRYKHAISLPQTETESILTRKLEELGGEIYRGHTVVEVLKNNSTHVELNVKRNADNATQVLVAKYVVAADGLRSVIRQSQNIAFEGGEYAESFLTADVVIDASAHLHPITRNHAHIYLDPAGILFFIPFPSPKNNLWRVIATVENAPKNPDRKYIDDIVRSRGPKATDSAVVTEVVWGSHFRINHRLAAQYRKHHILLAGDAAHTHSPAGGQGMNTGMQDAEYLATVLADALLSGRDSEADLDRYEKRTRPIAQGVVGLTHRMTVMCTITVPYVAWIRNRLIWLVTNSVPLLRRQMSWKLSGLER